MADFPQDLGQVVTEATREAATWLIRLEGVTSPQMWAEFQAWLDTSRDHEAQFVRLRAAWLRVDRLKVLRGETIDPDILSKLPPLTIDIPAVTIRAPGSVVAKLLRLLLTPYMYRLYVEPVLADMQHEYIDAYHAGRVWHARWIGVRGNLVVLLIQLRMLIWRGDISRCG